MLSLTSVRVMLCVQERALPIGLISFLGIFEVEPAGVLAENQWVCLQVQHSPDRESLPPAGPCWWHRPKSGDRLTQVSEAWACR